HQCRRHEHLSAHDHRRRHRTRQHLLLGPDYSPFLNEMLDSFAQQAIVNEKLGQDDDTDVLTVSFSANDYVGHRYGPYSQEAMDAALRVDREISKLLDFVDARVGLSNTLIA